MHYIKFMAITLIIFLTVGCAKKINTIPNSYEMSESSESLVIGEISFPPSEFILVGGTFTYTKEGTVTISNLQSGQQFKIVPKKAGDKHLFYVSLPKGDYRIDEVTWGGFEIKPFGEFKVNNRIVYIGNIHLEKIKEKTGKKILRLFANTSLRTRTLPIKYSIIDNYEKTIAGVMENLKEVNGDIDKSLIVLY